METNFNFKSSPCTSREQSERLLALGLKKEIRDAVLKKYIHNDKYCYKPILEDIDDRLIDCNDLYPAWSLHRLWELLNTIKKYEGEDELLYPRISLEEDDVIFVSPKSIWARRNFCSPKGVYENIINCFEELIKEGYFNKEYLEE